MIGRGKEQEASTKFSLGGRVASLERHYTVPMMRLPEPHNYATAVQFPCWRGISMRHWTESAISCLLRAFLWRYCRNLHTHRVSSTPRPRNNSTGTVTSLLPRSNLAVFFRPRSTHDAHTRNTHTGTRRERECITKLMQPGKMGLDSTKTSISANSPSPQPLDTHTQPYQTLAKSAANHHLPSRPPAAKPKGQKTLFRRVLLYTIHCVRFCTTSLFPNTARRLQSITQTKPTPGHDLQALQRRSQP